MAQCVWLVIFANERLIFCGTMSSLLFIHEGIKLILIMKTLTFTVVATGICTAASASEDESNESA